MLHEVIGGGLLLAVAFGWVALEHRRERRQLLARRSADEARARMLAAHAADEAEDEPTQVRRVCWADLEEEGGRDAG